MTDPLWTDYRELGKDLRTTRLLVDTDSLSRKVMCWVRLRCIARKIADRGQKKRG